jgi:hypothetical protein
VLVIEPITGLVKVLLVKVSVPVSVARVEVAEGKVITAVPLPTIETSAPETSSVFPAAMFKVASSVIKGIFLRVGTLLF